MSSAAQGGTATLTAQFFAYPGGPLADVTAPTIQINSPGGAAVPVQVGPTAVGVLHPATGVYQYAWAVPADAPLGDWIVQWVAVGGITTTEVVTVTDTPTATWSTIADVYNFTGITVTGPQLYKAHGVIASFEDIDPAAAGSHLGARDRRKLRMAEAYQAGWMFEQIGVFGRTDVSAVGQAGQGGSFTYAHPDAVTLAPLAKRNMDRLSWNESGAQGPPRSARYADWNAVRDAVLCDEVQTQPWEYEARGL
jgi:hypothetical protein